MNNLRKYIEIHEGKKRTAYRVKGGPLTIGVGFNLEKTGAKSRIKGLGLNYKAVCEGKVSLTDHQIDILFNLDAAQAVVDAGNFCSSFAELSWMRRIVLLDMAFNLGSGALSGFKKFQKALAEKNWNKAADEMKNSNWYNQARSRAEHNIYAMRYNKPHPDMVKAGFKVASVTTLFTPQLLWSEQQVSTEPLSDTEIHPDARMSLVSPQAKL